MFEKTKTRVTREENTRRMKIQKEKECEPPTAIILRLS